MDREPLTLPDPNRVVTVPCDLLDEMLSLVAYRVEMTSDERGVWDRLATLATSVPHR